MIARKNECDPRQLHRALADRLSEDQQRRLSAHLDDCDACRGQLEQLAGDWQWWDDTREMLCDISDAETGLLPHPALATSGKSRLQPAKLQAAQENAGTSVDFNLAEPVSGDWVLPLLDRPVPATGDATHILGTLDGIPITAIVGQGGMGVVLKGQDAALNRDVAVKLLSPLLANTGAARQRFFREAQAAAAIVHPNIVPIYAISADRSLPYLVMPFVGGGNLQQVVDRDGPLDLMRVLTIGLHVAEGLAAAHRQGIVHRDIKPANLMLDDGGFRVMITDFGLARALDDATLTGSGLLAGTPQYMSPEQACGQALDHRSDIYSLGAVLYTLATGRPPVRGTSTLEILRKIGEEPPRPVAELNESYPLWFMQLLGRLMAKSRDGRVASADEAAQLIRECLSHARSPMQVGLPRALQPASPAVMVAQSRSATAWLWRIAMTCALAVVIVLAALQVWPAWNKATSPALRQPGPSGDAVGPLDAGTSPGSKPGPGSAALDTQEWRGQQLEEKLSELESESESLLRELGW